MRTERKAPVAGRLVGLIHASSEIALPRLKSDDAGTLAKPLEPLKTAALSESAATRPAWPSVTPLELYVPLLAPIWSTAASPDVSPRRHQPSGLSAATALPYAELGGGGGAGGS